MSRRSPFSAVRVAVGHAVAALAVAAGLLLGPAFVSVVQATGAAQTVPPVTPDPASMATNPFIPDDANIGDCVSSLPRPECGTDQRSGYHQYVTFIILFLATIFIGWRVTLGVRARDRAINDNVPEKTKPTTKV